MLKGFLNFHHKYNTGCMTFALATGAGGVLQRSLYIRPLSAALGVGFGFGAIQIFDIRCIIKISEASILHHH